MKTKKKLSSRKGFSLAETLVAIIILLLVSEIVARGVPVARNAYEKIVVSANAQVLLSTTITALRDELGTAKDVEIKDAKTIEYYSADTGSTSIIKVTATDRDNVPAIRLQEFAEYTADIGTTDFVHKAIGGDTGSLKTEMRRLVSAKAGNGNLYITFDNVSVIKTPNGKDDYVQFTNLAVYRETDSEKPLAAREQLSIKLMAASIESNT